MVSAMDKEDNVREGTCFRALVCDASAMTEHILVHICECLRMLVRAQKHDRAGGTG